MLDMPDMKVPFAGSGSEMMDTLGRDGITRAIVDRMVPKINAYYMYKNWESALEQPIVYDDNHIINIAEYVTHDMFS